MAKTTRAGKRFSLLNEKNKNVHSKSQHLTDSSLKLNQSPSMKKSHTLIANLDYTSEIPKTNLVVLTLEQVSEMVQSIVSTALTNLKSNPINLPQEEYLNATKTIEFLQISRPTFQKLVGDGKIKAVQISERRILFKRSDLVEYINSRTIKKQKP
ncbi:helix-turn-helix domain-containing protein [Arcicella sp. LKC2W]|uniref:helix-turn-helix domain-containing protein n=1 Tax=Arcicella sp. LKC2W TaxID=2984198 RepID=UPI002B220486|nr:helix-turn-helix domain-containing protein [Arcicella sp. LKC2W]MEA5457820.1 helix-turn-helix domain-containing protein [Arcicella sp. LKC2W]